MEKKNVLIWAFSRRYGRRAAAVLVLLCVFTSLLLPLCVSAETTELTNTAQGFAIWNQWDIVGGMNSGGSIGSISWADSSSLTTAFTCAFKFPMIANLFYEVHYTITSDNDTRLDWMPEDGLSQPICVWGLNNPMQDIPVIGIDLSHSELFNDMIDTFFNPKNPLGSTTTIVSSTAAAPRIAEFKTMLMSDVSINDAWQFVTFEPAVISNNPSDTSYRLTMSGVSVYYNSAEVGAATLTELGKFEQDLQQIGVEVDLINTAVSQLSGDVKLGMANIETQIDSSTGEIKSEVSAQAAATRDEIRAQSELTQQIIQEDGEQTRDKLDEIYEKEKEDEQNAANKAGSDSDAAANEQIEAIDKALVSASDRDAFLGPFMVLWDALSSTEVKGSITFPGATLPSLHPSMPSTVLWEETPIEFDKITEMSWISLLLGFVKLLFNGALLWWCFTFFYELISVSLGKNNSEKTVLDVLFRRNPFTGGL